MFLHVKLHRELTRKTRVFIDGVEITRRCYAVEIKRGFAFVYKLNESGAYYMECERVARELLVGNLNIRMA